MLHVVYPPLHTVPDRGSVEEELDLPGTLQHLLDESCTKLKSWETITCWDLQGNHHSCMAQPSTVCWWEEAGPYMSVCTAVFVFLDFNFVDSPHISF